MKGYLEAVRTGFANFDAEQSNIDSREEGRPTRVRRMLAKLILSIDRRHDVKVAESIVDLALKNKDLVVGIDLCGDPTKGDSSRLKTAFRKAKEGGLKITVHLGEVNRTSLLCCPPKFEPIRLVWISSLLNLKHRSWTWTYYLIDLDMPRSFPLRQLQKYSSAMCQSKFALVEIIFEIGSLLTELST